MQAKSPAKINLFLEIIGKEGGLHQLHSLFMRVNLFDEITFKSSDILTVEYENQQVEGDVIRKTIRVLEEHFSEINTCFSISVRKNIPIGSGLGGASSNAAEVMKFIISENNLRIDESDLLKIGKEIGADVPFFLKQGSQILTGSSLELKPVSFGASQIPKLFGVIAFPKCELLTKDVFAKIMPPYTTLSPVCSFSDAITRNNEMQNAANLITNGMISRTLSVISHESAVITKMSGSGCACFSLFENKQMAKEFYDSLGESSLSKCGDIAFFFVETID